MRPDGLERVLLSLARPPIEKKNREVVEPHSTIMIEIGPARVGGVSNA
jgi:hypothetical protein